MYIKSIKKSYKNEEKILVYDRMIEIKPPKCIPHQVVGCRICFARRGNPVPAPSSLQRSKALISDYVLNNHFDLFGTFTFDPKKVDSMNIETTKKKMSKWLNNQKRHSPDMNYIFVPEKHKSGRIHFHALIGNYNGELIKTNIRRNGRTVYNLKNYKYGFTEIEYISDINRVANYIQKYITKDMLKIGNKKRFWASRNLKKPEKSYNVNLVEEVHKRPLFVKEKHRSQYYTIYRLVK